MRKIYQTRINGKNGNCMQAAIASLLDLNLEEVPDFISYEKDWGKVWFEFWNDRISPYYPTTINRDEKGTNMLIKIAKFDGGINGFLYATINSQTFKGETHAVIVDTNLNIIHDPNPNQKALLLTPEDILSITITSDMIIGKTGKLFSNKEWNNITEEERYENTYRMNEKSNKIVN